MGGAGWAGDPPPSGGGGGGGSGAEDPTQLPGATIGGAEAERGADSTFSVVLGVDQGGGARPPTAGGDCKAAARRQASCRRGRGGGGQRAAQRGERGQSESGPKFQSCLGVGVENSGPKKMMRVENLEGNVG